MPLCIAKETPAILFGSRGSAECMTCSVFQNLLPMVSCILSPGCVSCRPSIAIWCFFIVLLVAPHLSCEWSPLPFMFREAILTCFCLRLGWVSVCLGMFLSLCVSSPCDLSLGPQTPAWAVMSRLPVWLGGVDAPTVRTFVCLWRVYSSPPSWWVLMNSLLPWTFCPVSLTGESIMFPVPTVLGWFGPESVGGECDWYGIATLPS